MVVVKLTVHKKRREIPPLYFLKPSEQFSLFEERVSEVLSSLNSGKLTNRALSELMRRKGWKKLRVLRKKFERFDDAPLKKRKAVYNAFYRVFQRLQWAMESGSEREIELKVWLTSSIDYLCELVEVLEGKNG